MKRNYAAHRLILSADEHLSHQVVALEDGRVAGHCPLVGEPAFTQWLGGVIILSSSDALPDALHCPVPLDELIRLLTRGNNETSVSYAWHVTAADAATGVVRSVRRLR